MRGQICRVLTEDGLELQGLLVQPEIVDRGIGIVHVHGLAGNFYENRFIDAIGDSVSRNGFWFLSISTRGRDYISDFLRLLPDGSKTYLQIGAVYELFEDCLKDIDAWIRFLIRLGVPWVVLEGHSHGAVKVTYYAYKRPTKAVCGLILLSPSDDFGLQRQRLGEKFDQALLLAEDMIRRGQGRNLMPSQYFDYPVSAATYHDIFRSDSPLKIFNLSKTDKEEFGELGAIRVPVLTILGTENEAFIGSASEYLNGIRQCLAPGVDFEGKIVNGAPHNYLDHEENVSNAISSWLMRKLGGSKER